MVATAAAPVAPLVTATVNFITTLLNLKKDAQVLHGDFLGVIFATLTELRLIEGDMKKGKYEGGRQLYEVVCDIEDLVHDISIPHGAGLYPLFNTLLGGAAQQNARLKGYLQVLKDVRKDSAETSATEPSSASSNPRRPYASEDRLMGILEPKNAIMKLLVSDVPALKFISIVGCVGIGKTALARSLYDDKEVTSQFECKVWLVASECSNVQTIEAQFGKQLKQNWPLKTVQKYLKKKRYLVFIDDMPKRLQWNIHDIIPSNMAGSRIVLTTSIHSVAASYSSGANIYTMQLLDKDTSRTILWNNMPQLAPAMENGSESILQKCDGLPLALNAASDYLSLKEVQGLMSNSCCEEVVEHLGNFMTIDDSAFENMKSALTQSYDTLPDSDTKCCLAYTSIFPRGHQFKVMLLARKLIAERLLGNTADVHKCLSTLMDMSMLEPTPVRSTLISNSKRCEVHSMMREFAMQKSLSRNLVTFITHNELLHEDGRIRRLSIQNSTKAICEAMAKGSNLCSLRSLTTFSSELFDFKSSRLLRVLDLEGCKGLDAEFVNGICKLVFLKFISLRDTDITKIPKRVRNLKLLETLDIRETEVGILPMEVFMLPELSCLFGKFEVKLSANVAETREFVNFLKKDSKLHTLGGLAIGEGQRSEIIIKNTTSLKKLGIWYKSSASPRRKKGWVQSLLGDAASASQSRDGGVAARSDQCIEPTNELTASLLSSIGYRELLSLSIDFGGLQSELSDSLKALVPSIKLQQTLGTLSVPERLLEFHHISTLHLALTGMSSEQLETLQNLKRLEYLWISEDGPGFWDGYFSVQINGFPSLRLLSFKALRYPKVRVQQGAMPHLMSLQLICQESPPYLPQKVESPPYCSEPGEFEPEIGVKITHFQNLREVILKSTIDGGIVDSWKIAVESHSNRPCLKMLRA